VSSSIPVRIVGGDGADVLVDRSRVDGFALGLIPFIPDAETATIFYDDGRKTVVEEGASTSVVGATIAEPATLEERFEPQVPDFGHDWRYGPWLGYDSDLGLFVGGGPILYEFGFRSEPYVYRMSLLAGYATLAQTFRAQFDGDFRDVVGRSRLIVRARASGLEVQNYFGRGNESERDQRLVDADHYEVRQRQYTASVELGIPLFEGAEITGGIGGGYYRTDDPDEARFVTVERPYGVEPTTLLHGSVGLHIDTRDVASNPSSGLYVDVRGDLTPPVLEAVSAFASVQADVRGYIGADWPVQTTLALRAAGEKVMGGEIPFFALAMLGGAGSLRGFDSERFAGESSLAGGAELRVGILRFKVLVPGIIGVTAAVESGRVFHSAEHSTRWHTSYGGGLYLMLVERAITVSATAMRSEEALGVYLTGGFGW
jgi:hypothetical protein